MQSCSGVDNRAWCALMNRQTRSGSPCSPARTRLPPLPGCRAPDAGDGSHVEGAPVPPARRLSARQCACRHPARLASPKWKSTVRSARTHAPALRACVQIAPDRPSVAGTPADKRFGNGASDTSKINFKGVHQTGSTPTPYLHDCSGCFRLERLPGGALTHWKAPPFHGARQYSDPHSLAELSRTRVLEGDFMAN